MLIKYIYQENLLSPTLPDLFELSKIYFMLKRENIKKIHLKVKYFSSVSQFDVEYITDSQILQILLYHIIIFFKQKL
jgi:hypothetical protein